MKKIHKGTSKEITAAIKKLESESAKKLSARAIAEGLTAMKVGTLKGSGTWSASRVDYFRFTERHEENELKSYRVTYIDTLKKWISRGLSGDDLLRAKNTIKHLKGLGV